MYQVTRYHSRVIALPLPRAHLRRIDREQNLHGYSQCYDLSRRTLGRSCSKEHHFEAGITGSHNSSSSSSDQWERLSSSRRKRTHFLLYRSPSLAYLSAMSGYSRACCSIYSMIPPRVRAPSRRRPQQPTPTALARGSTSRSFFQELLTGLETTLHSSQSHKRYCLSRQMVYLLLP